MKKYIVSLVILGLTVAVKAQINNQSIFNRIRPNDTLTNELHFNFYNFNYVRNYEYSNKFHDGYTLYGTQLEPQLVYYAHPNLAITAGAYLRKDFGNEKGLYDAKPLFSVKYSKRDLTLVFGSLEGNIQHNYIEPLFDYERKVTTPVEYGTQLLIDKDKFKLDSWISWQKMIYRASPYKEEILGGANASVKIAGNDYWQLSWPLQFVAYHQGGQIDADRSRPLSTLFNGATGFKLKRKVSYNIYDVFTENYLVGYKDFSPTKVRAYSGGFGLWFNAGVNSKWGSVMASYWQGNRFITIQGMPLYQSVSDNLYSAGFTQQKRSVLTLRYLYQKELLPNFYLDVRFEPSFDLYQSADNLQFNHSFFITYKKDFRLARLKK